jgi:hypothetical protein
MKQVIKDAIALILLMLICWVWLVLLWAVTQDIVL